MERGACFDGAAVGSAAAFQGGYSWSWINCRQIPSRVCLQLCTLDTQCWWWHPGKFTSAEGDIPEGPQLSAGTEGEPTGTGLDICGEMRDAVGTSLLLGKSES